MLFNGVFLHEMSPLPLPLNSRHLRCSDGQSLEDFCPPLFVAYDQATSNGAYNSEPALIVLIDFVPEHCSFYVLCVSTLPSYPCGLSCTVVCIVSVSQSQHIFLHQPQSPQHLPIFEHNDIDVCYAVFFFFFF
jgi:hypothetical protein